MANWTGYPYSRGHVHVTGPAMSDPVDFDTGWLTDPGDVDLKKHVWAYKVSREMWRRMVSRSLQGCIGVAALRLKLWLVRDRL